MPFITINDLNLFYEEHGSGTPLVLIPGFGQSCYSYAKMLPHFANHFRTLAVDNRGVGQSPCPETSLTIDSFAFDIIALLDKLEIESAHILGQSMGTCICQSLMIHHPDRIKKAVLLAPFSTLTPVSKNTIRCQLKLLQNGFKLEDLHRLNASWLLSNELMRQKEMLEQFVHDMTSNPYPPTFEGLTMQANALLNCDLRKEIHKIPHDVLLLAGEEDLCAPVKYVHDMEREMKNAILQVVKNMGHVLPYEAPEKAAKLATDHYRK